MSICHATAQGKLWKPVTVLTRTVMGVLFKVQRNLVKVWRRSLFEEMQSPREWVLAVRLLPTPLYRGRGGGGTVWIAQTFTHLTHACMQRGNRELCTEREDEVLSALTVLDHNLWMRIEEIQCVSRRLTCNMAVEPLVILVHYNIPERDISLESIGLFSRPPQC